LRTRGESPSADTFADVRAEPFPDELVPAIDGTVKATAVKTAVTIAAATAIRLRCIPGLLPPDGTVMGTVMVGTAGDQRMVERIDEKHCLPRRSVLI
jgi:hypothetical protein